jgi:adenylate cyclase
MIDGPSGLSGAQLRRRTPRLLVPAVALSNFIGAWVLLVLGAFVIPRPAVNLIEAGPVNIAALLVYLTIALIIGVRLGLVRYYRQTTAWLEQERIPTAAEQRGTLRTPRRIVLLHALLWAAAAPMFALLNARYSGSLAVTAGVTALLGGFVTTAAAFLLTIRIGRPIAARTLAAGVPHRPVMPGMTTRALMAWALGSGVAVLGIMLIAAASLVQRDINRQELAVAALGLGAVALVVGAGMVLFAARGTAAPVLAVRDAIERVERGDLEAHVHVIDDSELGLMQAGFNCMVDGLREREQIRDLFGRHVGEDVAREALRREVQLGGEVRDVAVLFVDIVGSTTMASTRPATEVVELLNRFFDLIVEVVTAHGGWINKSQGDAALAVFGVPIPQRDAPSGALAAGRELAHRVRDEIDGVDAGIGISAGEAVAGNIGAEQRYEYTVIGDPVNEAARLTELAKSYEERVLASGSILDRADHDEATRWHLADQVTLRGRPQPTRIAIPTPAAIPH